MMASSKRCHKLSPLSTKNPPPCSPSLSLSSTLSSRFSWSSSCNSDVDESPVSPITNEEYDRLIKARERLARREIELRQIIRHCNGEMDIIRRKLCKDLGIMEILKAEIEKAGSGPMREELEMDFHNGIQYQIVSNG
jgi:hypothetical protein